MPPGTLSGTGPGTPPRCRICSAEVALDTVTCPECSAPRPALPLFEGEGFTWRTRATWIGLPLVDIAFGLDATGRLRTARGIVAIGQRAVGVVAIGILAAGGVGIGIVGVGLASAGVVALGAVAAFGVNAIAPAAYGVTAAGLIARGVSVLSWR